MANHILAVHLAAGHIGFGVAESTLRSLRVTALGRMEAGSTMFADLVSDRNWDRVVASVPAEAAVFRILDFAFHDRRRLGQAVGPALEEHVPFSLDDSVASFDLVGPGRHGSVLAVMAQRAALESHLETLHAYDIWPQRLIWAPSATLEIWHSD